MRLQTALAIIVLATSVGVCGGGASPITPGVPGVPRTSGAPVDLKSSLSAAFDALAIPGNAACSISISQNGQVVLERGRGQISPGLTACGDSLYRIASLIDPLTASAVLVSEQAGRLLRSDKINRFIVYPEPAPTIDELIEHIPGLPNYADTGAYYTGSHAPATLENLLSLIAPWDGIRRYQYSNSHYVLLAAAL